MGGRGGGIMVLAMDCQKEAALAVKCALLILPDLDKSLLRFLPDLLNSVWLQL